MGLRLRYPLRAVLHLLVTNPPCLSDVNLHLLPSNALIKLLNVQSAGVTAWQLLLLRCCFQLTAVSPVIVWKGSSLVRFGDTKTRLLVSCQALLGGLMLLCVFEAIERLPIGDFSAIAFSSPCITMILSTCLLGETCGPYRATVGGLLISGVFIISRPSVIFGQEQDVMMNSTSLARNMTSLTEVTNKSSNLTGICLALTTACLSALMSIITKKSSKVATTVLVFWYGLGGLVVSLVGLLCLDSSSSSFSSWSAVTWSLALAQSVLGMAGVCCLYTALTFTSPTSVMIIRSEEIVLSYIIQVTAFGSSLHLLDFLGAFFIVFSVLAIGLESLVSGKLAQCCSSSTTKLDDLI